MFKNLLPRSGAAVTALIGGIGVVVSEIAGLAILGCYAIYYGWRPFG
ncbi:MAG TPA: hypothetical protein V6D07_18490 [Trichocoleus sp.]